MAKKLKPINECKTVAELLSSPSRWTRNTNARNNLGGVVCTNNPKACRFCLMGAIYRISANTNIDSSILVKKWYDGNHDLNTGITWFNDSNSFKKVRRSVLKAKI